MHDERRPDQPGVAQHHREQPDDANGAGLVGELGAELGEVDLRLLPRRRLEPALEADGGGWPDRAQELGELAVTTRMPEPAQLAQQTPGRQVGVGRHALAQVGVMGIEQRRPGTARAVVRRLEAGLDVFADGLAVDAGASGDGRHRQALAVQVKDHDNFPKSDHQRRLPRRQASSRRRLPATQDGLLRVRVGNFQPALLGRIHPAVTTLATSRWKRMARRSAWPCWSSFPGQLERRRRLFGMRFYASFSATTAGLARFGEAIRRELNGRGPREDRLSHRDRHAHAALPHLKCSRRLVCCLT